MRSTLEKDFDVLILGSGMAGGILATVLAKYGVRVGMLDADSHPRFAVGESTIPHTSLLLSILAARHGIPEIDYLAYPDRIADHICTTCGVKRAFGFAYHRPGKEFDPREGLQFGTSSKDENHLFRQDIDAYLVHTAVRYGAVHRDRVRVEAVEIDRDGVRVRTGEGEELRAQFIVDGTGYKGAISRANGLREEPTPLKHHARTLFTHMVGVKTFEEGRSPMCLPWNLSTLHHVFERGWIWVIPFNNQPRSTNPLVSVGLTIDPRRYPRPKIHPEEEFRRFVEMFPSVVEQFQDARAVRSWVATDRMQFSSKRATGYRFCLMSHAAGFIDPLFSRGLINTTEIIYALIDPLLAALADGDFAEERFAHIDRLQNRVLHYNDRLVNGAFISWDDFDLHNAWMRVWALGTILTEFRLMDVLQRYTETADPRVLEGRLPDPASSDFEDPDYGAYFRRAVPVIEAYEAGTISAADAAERIFAMIADYEFPVILSEKALRRACWMTETEKISERNLTFARRGYRWAIANPTTRDLFGSTETFYRWRSKYPDPHVVAEPASARRPSATE